MPLIQLLARSRALIGVTGGLFMAAPFLSGQVVLTGTAYTQNFNGLESGLPAGWSVYTGATGSALGTATSLVTTKTSWGSSHDTGGLFRNSSGANIASTSIATQQSANTDRALGWRPESAVERNGAITLELTNTSGFENFTLSVDVFTFNDVGPTTTYALEYRVGETGTFTQLGSTYTTGAVFSVVTYSFDSVALSALADKPDPVFIRLRGLSSTDTGTMDGVAIDNFSLTYSAIAAASPIPEPSTYGLLGGASVLLVGLVRRRNRSSRSKPASVPSI